MPLLDIESFCEKYALSEGSIRVMKSSGRLPPSAFHKDKKNIYVKEEYFLRKIKFYDDLKELAQNCYFLLEHHFCDSDIARTALMFNGVDANESTINSMRSFLNNALFSNVTRGEKLNTSRLTWYMARYAWSIERRLRRKGASIKKVIDNRNYDED
jgi:hypothetical protein